MKNKFYMTISEFAYITGIKRANLIFYDNIGLLSPEFRGDNDYRYYSRKQLGTAYLIASLRELGIGLREIRQYAEKRTPEKMLTLFNEQEIRIEKEIIRLSRMKDMMGLYKDMTEDAIHRDIAEIVVRRQEKEPLFLGETAKLEQTNEQASIEFYEYAAKQGMELGYPMGCIVKKQSICADNPMEELQNPVCQYYFKVKQGCNAYKPEGLYVTGYGLCAYGESDSVYEKLFEYIKEKRLHICGDAYEEYPMNEMSVKDDSKYCVKVEIMVEY